MKNRKKSHKVTSALLFALSAILVAASIAGYAARTNGGTRENLNEMRTYAVMHAATSGVVESLVTDAGAAKLKELRARKDFRQLGGDEVNRIYEEAKAQTRAESEGKYAAALDIVDTEGLIAPINAFCAAQNVYAEARETERAAYAALYTELVKAVGDWAELTEGLDDDQLLAALQAKIPALTKPENAHLGAGFVRMARAMADAANMKKRAELQTQLTSAMISSVSNWEELYDAAEDDEALWAALTARLSELKENETFKAELLTEARACIQQAKDGVEIVAPSLSETDEPEEDAEIVVDEQYFSVSEATAALEAPADEAYDALWGALVERIPDLDSLSAKYKKLIRASIVEIAESENAGFMTRYRIYEKQSAASLLSGAAALMMKAAAYAEQVVIAGIAALILALAVTFWGTLIRRLGVPRTIISLFFIYLLLGLALCAVLLLLKKVSAKKAALYAALCAALIVVFLLPGVRAVFNGEKGLKPTTVPLITWVFILLLCVFNAFIMKTRLGQKFRAVGQNRTVANAAGINVDRTRVIAIMISTVLAGWGQILFMQSEGIGVFQTYSAHEQVGLYAGAAILVGGASIDRATNAQALIGTFLFHSLFITAQNAASNLFGDSVVGEYFRAFLSYGVIALALVIYAWRNAQQKKSGSELSIKGDRQRKAARAR